MATRGRHVAADWASLKTLRSDESRPLDSDRTARIARGFSFRGQAEEGWRSVADGDEARRRGSSERVTVNESGRRLAKWDEAVTGRLTDRSDGDGGHRRRRRRREIAAGSSPNLKKKAALVHGFDWALVGLGSGSKREAWGCFSPPLIRPGEG